jgi:glycine cleavage system H protein
VAGVPEDLKYTAEHEWLRSGEASATVRVGITDYAQEALGDVVYVSLPDVGATVKKGDVVGEVESTKSVSDIYAPVSGTVSGRNERLDENPELINSDPYGAGWMVEIEVSDTAELDGLMDANGYAAHAG